MKFTVRAVSIHSVTVDFEDGSWAEVPYNTGIKDQKDLLRLIDTYHNQTPKIMTPLLEEGVSYESLPLLEELPDEDDGPLVGYKEMRKGLYPDIGDQLDAAYWARHGKPERQQEIDTAIEEVKRVVPKNLAPMTNKAFSLYLLSNETN